MKNDVLIFRGTAYKMKNCFFFILSVNINLPFVKRANSGK
jgi:hypothetical protein